MDIRKLQRAIVDGLEDVKAQNIAVFNTEALSPLFERVIIASGTSNRQTKALASSVRDTVKARGMQVLRTEGEENGEWIIVDCGAAVAHIMQPAIRDYYHLEEIWGGKAVRMKVGASVPGRAAARANGGAAASKGQGPSTGASKGTSKGTSHPAPKAARPSARGAAAAPAAPKAAAARRAKSSASAPAASARRRPDTDVAKASSAAAARKRPSTARAARGGTTASSRPAAKPRTRA